MALLVVQRLAPYAATAFGYESGGNALWNFSPVMAICLFSGARLGRKLAWIIPLGGMLLSDLILLIWKGPAVGLYAHQALTYLCFAFAIFLGTELVHSRNASRIGVSALAGETVFFLVTNFGSWLVLSNVYSRDVAGLVHAYAGGLPFFFRSLASTCLYSAGLFAVWEMVTAQDRSLENSLAGQHIQ